MFTPRFKDQTGFSHITKYVRIIAIVLWLLYFGYVSYAPELAEILGIENPYDFSEVFEALASSTVGLILIATPIFLIGIAVMLWIRKSADRGNDTIGADTGHLPTSDIPSSHSSADQKSGKDIDSDLFS